MGILQRLKMRITFALAAVVVGSLTVVALVGAQQCTASQRTVARSADCSCIEAQCLAQLNSTAGIDSVDYKQVEAHMMKLMPLAGSDEQQKHRALYAAGAEPSWSAQVEANHCETVGETVLPATEEELERLQIQIAALKTQKELPVVVVHYAPTIDGVGAQFKKNTELIVSLLSMGLDGVALNQAPGGSYIAPAGLGPKGELLPTPPWGEKPLWCHNSPMQHNFNGTMYPMACWRLDWQREIMREDPDPQRAVLLWGAAATSGPFHCLRLLPHPEDAVWKYMQQTQVQRVVLDRLFSSVRSFSDVARTTATQSNPTCGFGDAGAVHVAMHLRRGDVGETSGYGILQRFGAEKFGKWLCKLSQVLDSVANGRKIMLHVYTEVRGNTRAALRATAPAGFTFDEREGDSEGPVYHATGQMKTSCANVAEQVHWIVNDSPRDAILCMARADVLITSLSSMSWASALLSSAPVFHPKGKSGGAHWDLRDDYLDWAQNWFGLSDIAIDSKSEEITKSFLQGQQTHATSSCEKVQDHI